MANITNFNELYKTLSNSELLKILENSDDYLPAAIESAKQEFAKRQLTEAEIMEAKESLTTLELRKEKQREKIKNLEEKVKTTSNTFFETINPIQAGVSSIERSIRLITIVFSGLFLFELSHNYNLIKYYAQNLPHSSSLILAPLIILPFAAFAFWKRWKIGWTLLTIYSTFSIIGVLFTFYQIITWRSTGLAALDRLYPRPSSLTYTIQLLFLAGMLYVLCKKDMRDIYSITKVKMQFTIVITAIATFLLILNM